MHKRSLSRGVLAALAFAASLQAALDPSKKISQYTHEMWGTEAGLPQNSVTSIVQTPDGFLWFGTEEGLVRFDGFRFTVFDKSNTPALGTSEISVLLADSDGALWIG